MNKAFRQYFGIAAALAAYMAVHEGAHLLAALCMGVFRRVRFLGLGLQVDVLDSAMSDVEMGVFCLAGAAATLCAAAVLTILAGRICALSSATLKAVMYYVTMAMLLADPLYLSVLCRFFGGGDMNGISLLVPEVWARAAFGALLLLGAVIFAARILPLYKQSFLKYD